MDNNKGMISDKEQSLTQLLRSTQADSFGPYFSDRVMKRIYELSTADSESLYDALRWVFVRTSLVGLTAAVILCMINVMAFQDLGVVSNWVDALFGLPSASISDALSYGDL